MNRFESCFHLIFFNYYIFIEMNISIRSQAGQTSLIWLHSLQSSHLLLLCFLLLYPKLPTFEHNHAGTGYPTTLLHVCNLCVGILHLQQKRELFHFATKFTNKFTNTMTKKTMLQLRNHLKFKGRIVWQR